VCPGSPAHGRGSGLFFFPARRHRGEVKLALHRSLIFWAGIVVMVFIGWAWRDSKFHLHTVRGGAWSVFHAYSAVVASYTPTHRQSLSYYREELLVTHVAKEPFPLPFIGRGQRPSAGDFVPLEEGPRTLRDNWRHYLRFQPPTEWVFFIPHWMLLLVFVVPWSGVLVWRARRRRRADSKEG
jgi:hypothetical protein